MATTYIEQRRDSCGRIDLDLFVRSSLGTKMLEKPELSEGDYVTVVVVDNGTWKVAAVVYDDYDLQMWNAPAHRDPRPRKWWTVKREIVNRWLKEQEDGTYNKW